MPPAPRNRTARPLASPAPDRGMSPAARGALAAVAAECAARDAAEEAEADEASSQDPGPLTSIVGFFDLFAVDTTPSHLPYVWPLGAPPYLPLSELVPTTRVPTPPLLEPGNTPDRDVQLLAMAFLGAVQHVFQQPSFALGRQPLPVPTTARIYPVFRQAAAVLRAAEIAPAAWAWWSCEVWRDYHPDDSLPAPGWVFSENRLDKKRGWFERETKAGLGGDPILTPAMRDYRDRMGTYHRAVLLQRPVTAEEAAALFAQIFPGDTFAGLRAVVARDAQDTRRALEHSARNGVWVWDRTATVAAPVALAGARKQRAAARAEPLPAGEAPGWWSPSDPVPPSAPPRRLR